MKKSDIVICVGAIMFGTAICVRELSVGYGMALGDIAADPEYNARARRDNYAELAKTSGPIRRFVYKTIVEEFDAAYDHNN